MSSASGASLGVTGIISLLLHERRLVRPETMITTETGLQYTDVVEGQGAAAEAGTNVKIGRAHV